jgi:hypothetical protein
VPAAAIGKSYPPRAGRARVAVSELTARTGARRKPFLSAPHRFSNAR